MTIEDAVVEVLSGVPTGDTFHGPWLSDEVNKKLGRKRMDGSATKLLRVARREGRLNYEVLNRKRSLYRKLPVYSEPAPVYKELEGGQLAMRI